MAKTKKLKPSEAPQYFEYEPNEDSVDDKEVMASMYARGDRDGKGIYDPVFKKQYLAYVKAQKDAQ
jgi:hypothetical protein